MIEWKHMDRTKVEAFLEKFVGFASGATTIGLLAVADRSGLSAYLGEHESGTAEEIAEGASLEARYTREILSGLAAAGVVEYDADTGVFTLPPEHALFLSSDASPYFMGGWLDMLPLVMSQIEGVATATVHGGGVGFEEFGPGFIKGIDRGNGPSQRVFLIKKWLPAVTGLIDRLDEGIRVADVGCGSGTAAVLIAEAFPNAEVFGFDVSSDSIAVARSRSENLANLEFHDYTVEEIPTEPGFDLITSFDVIHDLADPMAALGHIREALRTAGVYLMMEPDASSYLENNLHDRGALLYGISALHCMTQSLARDGAGLGAAWGTETAERMADEAGFSSFEKLDAITNSFSAFYVLRP
ncbi:MAG: class I SAM-dependent methyltransferase [Acidimicrobiia bacterium]